MDTLSDVQHQSDTTDPIMINHGCTWVSGKGQAAWYSCPEPSSNPLPGWTACTLCTGRKIPCLINPLKMAKIRGRRERGACKACREGKRSCSMSTRLTGKRTGKGMGGSQSGDKEGNSKRAERAGNDQRVKPVHEDPPRDRTESNDGAMDRIESEHEDGFKSLNSDEFKSLNSDGFKSLNSDVESISSQKSNLTQPLASSARGRVGHSGDDGQSTRGAPTLNRDDQDTQAESVDPSANTPSTGGGLNKVVVRRSVDPGPTFDGDAIEEQAIRSDHQHPVSVDGSQLFATKAHGKRKAISHDADSGSSKSKPKKAKTTAKADDENRSSPSPTSRPPYSPPPHSPDSRASSSRHTSTSISVPVPSTSASTATTSKAQKSTGRIRQKPAKIAFTYDYGESEGSLVCAARETDAETLRKLAVERRRVKRQEAKGAE